MYRIGMIGLGKMGLPIARNLVERGFAVTGYRRSGAADLEAVGGVAASSPAEVAREADVLLSILPDAAAVEQIVCGPQGTLEQLRPGTVHIEMSTVSVTHKRRVREAVVAAGGDMLDCPISGGPGMVTSRQATTCVSGDLGSVDAVEPVLDAISAPWVYTGAFGTGASMKYVANLLVAVHTAAAAEALVFARRAGLDLELVQQALDNSMAGSTVFRHRGPVMRQRAWLPAPGPIETLHAILEQIAVAGAAMGVDTPVFTATKELFDKAVSDGSGHLDIAAVHDQFDPLACSREEIS